MRLSDRVLKNYITLDEDAADSLSAATSTRFTVEVKPPFDREVPVSVYRFVKGITEYQTAWLGFTNRSPVSAFEIRRDTPERLRLQFSVVNQRLERKVRTMLSENIPGVGFETGVDGLPVSEGDTIGGGYLTTGKSDWYPLRTGFEVPPTNSVVSSLHRDAMPESRIIIQLLFQPINRGSVGARRWARRALKEANYLRREHQEYVPSHQRTATPPEREQAIQVEEKVERSRFKTVIRILVIGGDDATLSHVKEVTGGFNIFEAETGQYLKTRYLRTLRSSRLQRFAEAIRDREFRGWGLPFQSSDQELAALVSIPDRAQQNILTAPP